MFEDIKNNKIIKIFLVSSLAGIIQCAFSFILNKSGYIFGIPVLSTDPGSDFYLSIMLSNNLNPYIHVIFPYPPLIVIFYYLISIFCSDKSLIINAPLKYTEIMFRLENIFSKIKIYKCINYFVTVCIFFLFVIVLFKFLNRKFSRSSSILISIFLILNVGILGALLRGNCILICILFTCFFCMNYDIENIIIKELALISLAIAFNIKPYVAIFGFLLICDKKYLEAVRTSAYALCLFILPMLFLKNGFVNNIKNYFSTLFNFGDDSLFCLGLKPLIKITDRFISKFFYIDIHLEKISLLIILILTVFLLKKTYDFKYKWEKFFILFSIMIMCANYYAYALGFMVIPFAAFLREENINIKFNFIYLFLFLLLTVPFRINSYYINLFYNFVLIITTTFLVCNNIKNK